MAVVVFKIFWTKMNWAISHSHGVRQGLGTLIKPKDDKAQLKKNKGILSNEKKKNTTRQSYKKK